MHSSGSMVRKFGPSWKQSTGQTSTQSMYLHLMQFSVTTKVIRCPQGSGPRGKREARPPGQGIVPRPRSTGESARVGASQAPVDGHEMMRLAPGGPVLEVAPQREVSAREGDVGPGNLGRLHQHDLEALRPGCVARRRQAGAE